MIARLPRTTRNAAAPRNVSSNGRNHAGRVAATALALLGLFAAADASAAGDKDAEANKLYDAAMNDDYLNVELAKAEKGLLPETAR